ncbi:hypothetical protein [Falsiroseomonas selenitidurans]|uniref:EthD domain-containing protein n=1 Tax=Falsiroseomonas selenitidurans TaxID=2716335 RepID=A0ABX1E0D9_9PROT|nr:hypothetical protein [Falsiroseomonas selenitidurans]NKC30616.1 hypothetical protein [Falsiroseomonas selenitidurans]
MQRAIVYIVELGLPAEALAGFTRWYAGAHAPHLFQGGFTSCASYLAVSGGLSVVDIYQAPGWSVFESPAFARYRRLAAADAHRPPVLAEVANPRTVYHHHHHPAGPAPDAETDAAAPLDADWVLLWRLPAAAEAAAAAWLSAGGAEALRGLGAQGIRLLHRGRDTPTGTTDRPPLALLTEWATRPPEDAALATLPEALRTPAAADGFCGLRLYPWPNAPEALAERARLVPGG